MKNVIDNTIKEVGRGTMESNSGRAGEGRGQQYCLMDNISCILRNLVVC